MDSQFLTPSDLSQRYQGALTVKTLAHWRCAGTGPAFTKIGGKILYALQDVLRWEASRRLTHAARGAQP